MKICKTIADLRSYRRSAECGKLIFIPTMGALHEGHGSLIQMARKIAGKHGIVITSIFVNPTQFGPHEDFHKYPRPFKLDLAHLTRWNADVVFAPSPEEMYPAGSTITINPGPLGEVLEGAVRPGHFRGVATVVAKLLNLVQPAVMILGQKDFQQQLILRRMVADLNMPVEIITAPTIREPDGLAMSSRNRYLSVPQRACASAIYQALTAASDQYHRGQRDAATLQSAMYTLISQAGMEVQYALACHAETLTPFSGLISRPAVLLVAAKLGTTRLIDNMLLA
ncbi:MAG: pantoate--beta-alanine ligase [Phycisphaerae bacterium]